MEVCVCVCVCVWEEELGVENDREAWGKEGVGDRVE
jgi:hypothetical protein